MRRPNLLAVALGLLALVVCVLVYRPGLSSGFVFDDAANLPALGESGTVDTPSVFFRYVTSGRADPTGRPVSLVSFLFDANDWPASPAPFKRTNLLIHLLCGALLCGLLRRLGALHGLTARRANVAALFASTAWLLHPLFVSTVLYTVQREAMLPAFFILCGLHLWLSARLRISAKRPSVPLLFAAMACCTTLAFLSKPNGILLPLLALCIDATLPPLADRAAADRYRRWKRAALWPIATAVMVGLIWVLIRSIGNGTATARSFTLLQRVLTEPTILLDYLKLLFLFDPSYGSVFHDQYPAAADALHPWYTMPALLACLSACAVAFWLRRRWPVVASAVLFFFAGHLIESTSLALELYFEHRNYLPSMLLFWPLGVALSAQRWRAISAVLAVTILIGLAAVTHATAALWSKPLEQARFWAREAPGSPRAQAYAAQMEASYGNVGRALRGMQATLRRFPTEPQIALTLIDLRCQQGAVTTDDWARAERALRESGSDPGALLSQWVERAIASAEKSACVGLDRAQVAGMLDAASANPQVARLPGRMQDVSHLRGLLSLSRGDAAEAKFWFDDALRRDPKPDVALAQAALLGAAGFPEQGLAHLDYYDTLEVAPVRPTQGMRWLHAQVLDYQEFWPHEMASLRATLSRHLRKATL